LTDVAKALEDAERTDARVVHAIRAARDGGITYRQMGEATGRSHEHFRAVLLRDKKR